MPEPAEARKRAESLGVIQAQLPTIFSPAALQLLADRWDPARDLKDPSFDRLQPLKNERFCRALYLLRPRKPKSNTLPGRLVQYGINAQVFSPVML